MPSPASSAPARTLQRLAPGFVREWLRALPPAAQPLYADLCARPGTTDAAVEALRCGGAAILLAEDPWDRDAIVADLEGGHLAGRVRIAATSPEPGTIQVLPLGVANGVGTLLDAARTRPTLLAADPPGPEALPLAPLADLLAQTGADLLARFPHEGLRRPGAAYGSVADLPLGARRTADAYAALFGDRRPEWLLAWRATAQTADRDAADAEAADRWADRLRSASPDHAHRSVPLWAGDAGPDWMMLAAADPWRLLAMNRVLRCAPASAWAHDPASSPKPEPDVPLDLFGGEASLVPAVRLRPVAAVADGIRERFVGDEMTVADLLAMLATSDLVPEEVQRALAWLKRTGGARFSSLRDPAAEVVFPEHPRPAAPRSRSRPGGLGLWDDGG